MGGNLLIVHGGGPTAVINASLYGAIRQAQESPRVDRVLAAIGGTGGLFEGGPAGCDRPAGRGAARAFVQPGIRHRDQPGRAGSAGIRGDGADLEKHNIRYVLMNGGNGTMDTCGKLYRRCKEKGIAVIGIPKTMDNDLAVTDHSPGFGSAARYMAGSVAEVCCDVAGLPIHVVVVEALGRNAGWVTAASALAADSYGHGPDLIYLPERDFCEEEFLADVEQLIRTKGHGVVVASEGLHYAGGTPIVEPIFTVGRATYFGDVSAHLANLIIRRLGYKARSEKPGLLGRASIAWQSEADRQEAELCGRAAVDAATSGESGKMVALRRVPGPHYRCETFLADISQVMMTERKLPEEFINQRGNGVTEEFKTWCRPLLGSPLPKLMDLRG